MKNLCNINPFFLFSFTKRQKEHNILGSTDRPDSFGSLLRKKFRETEKALTNKEKLNNDKFIIMIKIIN